MDVVGSDHAPHARAAKEKPWPLCAAGLTGVQTIVPLMLDHVSAGRLSLMRLADLMCAGPARVYGVRGKGRIARGYDADFTLVDMGRRRVIEESWIASPCGWTPFAGMGGAGLAGGDDHPRPDRDAGRRGAGRAGRTADALRG